MRTRWIKLKQNHQKLKRQAATVPSTREDELAKQPQIPAAPDRFLGGPGQETSISSQSHKGLLQRGQYKEMDQGCNPRTHGEEVKGAGVCLGSLTLEPLPSPGPESPQFTQGAGPVNRCWQCGEVGHYRRECPTLKEKGLFKQGNA